MKHEYSVLKNNLIVGADESRDKTQSDKGTKLDQAIEDIQSRANHMGSVMEEIMQAHGVNQDESKEQK
jgi:hypothetical protein